MSIMIIFTIVRKTKREIGHPKDVDFQGDGSFDVVFDIISWKFKQFWIPHDRGNKIRSLGGIAEHIRNVRNLRIALR